jgi:hypothetical protein
MRLIGLVVAVVLAVGLTLGRLAGEAWCLR